MRATRPLQLRGCSCCVVHRMPGMVAEGQHVMGALARMRTQNEEDARAAAAGQAAADVATAKAAAEVRWSCTVSTGQAQLHHHATTMLYT